MAESISNSIITACEKSMPKRKHFTRRNIWWNRKLTVLKRMLNRCRKNVRRENDPERKLTLRKNKLAVQRTYEKELSKARRESWQKFVTDIGNKDPFGIVYKLTSNKLSNDEILSTLKQNGCTSKTMRETAKILLETHVPDLDIENETEEQAMVSLDVCAEPIGEDCEPFSPREVKVAVKAFRNGKAPGLDLIETQVLKKAVKSDASLFTNLFNRCLKIGYFPKCWKDDMLST